MYARIGASERDHTALSARPRPLSVEVDGAHPRQLLGQVGGHRPGAVGAGVVGDGDAEGVGERLPQVGVQPPDAGPERHLLVVDGDDHVEDGCGAHDWVAAVVPAAEDAGWVRS